MRRPELLTAPIAQGAAGTTTVVAAVANKRIVVESCSLVISAAGTAKFRSASASDLTGAYPLAANGGLVLPTTGSDGMWFETTTGEALTLVTTGGAGNGCITYRLEDL